MGFYAPWDDRVERNGFYTYLDQTVRIWEIVIDESSCRHKSPLKGCIYLAIVSSYGNC